MIKFLTKYKANQIQQHIETIIHYAQVGLIPGVQILFNICKSVNVVHHVGKEKDKNHIGI